MDDVLFMTSYGESGKNTAHSFCGFVFVTEHYDRTRNIERQSIDEKK